MGWSGFLRSPGIYRPFLSEVKTQCLETARLLEELGEDSERYVDFLTFVALDPSDTFKNEELALAIKSLTSDS